MLFSPPIPACRLFYIFLFRYHETELVFAILFFIKGCFFITF